MTAPAVVDPSEDIEIIVEEFYDRKPILRRNGELNQNWISHQFTQQTGKCFYCKASIKIYRENFDDKRNAIVHTTGMMPLGLMRTRDDIKKRLRCNSFLLCSFCFRVIVSDLVTRKKVEREVISPKFQKS